MSGKEILTNILSENPEKIVESIYRAIDSECMGIVEDTRLEVSKNLLVENDKTKWVQHTEWHKNMAKEYGGKHLTTPSQGTNIVHFSGDDAHKKAKKLAMSFSKDAKDFNHDKMHDNGIATRSYSGNRNKNDQIHVMTIKHPDGSKSASVNRFNYDSEEQKITKEHSEEQNLFNESSDFNWDNVHPEVKKSSDGHFENHKNYRKALKKEKEVGNTNGHVRDFHHYDKTLYLGRKFGESLKNTLDLIDKHHKKNSDAVKHVFWDKTENLSEAKGQDRLDNYNDWHAKIAKDHGGEHFKNIDSLGNRVQFSGNDSHKTANKIMSKELGRKVNVDDDTKLHTMNISKAHYVNPKTNDHYEVHIGRYLTTKRDGSGKDKFLKHSQIIKHNPDKHF